MPQSTRILHGAGGGVPFTRPVPRERCMETCAAPQVGQGLTVGRGDSGPLCPLQQRLRRGRRGRREHPEPCAEHEIRTPRTATAEGVFAKSNLCPGPAAPGASKEEKRPHGVPTPTPTTPPHEKIVGAQGSGPSFWLEGRHILLR